MMDSFFVPALAGQIYTMPGMQTQLHAVINKPGVYKGFSANYSGAGFTDMRFSFHGMTTQNFKQRSEEHTSELQSLMRISYAVFCLKKKQVITNSHRQQSYIIYRVKNEITKT